MSGVCSPIPLVRLLCFFHVIGNRMTKHPIMHKPVTPNRNIINRNIRE